MQGQSDITEAKLRGFRSIFTQNLSVCCLPSFNDPTYIHVDLHAGSGFNEDIKVLGSPVIFCEEATKLGCRWKLFCAEFNKGRCQQLADRLCSYPDAYPFCGNNEELCYLVPDLLRESGISPSRAVGTVLIDPNGCTDKKRGSAVVPQIPWDGLEYLFNACPRLDCLFNFPGTAMQRIQHMNHKDWVHLNELPERLNKTHWYIREPLPTWKFTAMCGRNTDRVKCLSGFAPFNSERGRTYRDKCMMTVDEFNTRPLVGQLPLFK